MAWAKTVPAGARYDLTKSGVADTLVELDAAAIETPPERLQPWTDAIPVSQLCRRDAAIEAQRAFIEAVARRYAVDPTCVIPTLGASMAVLHAMIALIRAGDHVVVERPTYEALHRAPEILGARVSRLERTFDTGWAVVPERLAQLLTSKTRAVILTNLHNPSGVATDVATMRAITELSARVGAAVLVDEVFLDYTFQLATDTQVLPACKVAPNTISWSSANKAFGFSALRAGWIITPDRDMARALTLATEYLYVQPPAATMLLGMRVLEQAHTLQKHAETKANAGRRIVERWLAAESRVSWVAPSAGITGLLRLPEFLSDTQFAEHLRERYDTQVAPGVMFEAPGYVRISFGLPSGELEQALANISAALDDILTR